MNILVGTLALMALAAWVWGKLGSPANRRAALAGMFETLRVILPRVAVALVGAGFFAELLPAELVSSVVGDASGWRGILIATGLGILTPGGAFVSFALAAAALQVGASVPAMIAYVTAWALFALTKLIAEEWSLMGPRFILLRLLVSWPLPLITGFSALALV